MLLKENQISQKANNLKKNFDQSPYYALLDIHKDEFTLYSNQQISLSVSEDIERQIEQIIEINNLKKAGINPEIIENAKTDIQISTKVIDAYKEVMRMQV